MPHLTTFWYILAVFGIILLVGSFYIGSRLP